MTFAPTPRVILPGGDGRSSGCGVGPVRQVLCAPSPITAAETATYKIAQAAVPYTDARPTFVRRFLTYLAVIAATSTPMNENRTTAAAMLYWGAQAL